MKKLLYIGLILLALLVGSLLGGLVFSKHTVETITEYKIVPVVETIEVPTECDIVQCRVLKTQIELSQERAERLELLEEYKENGYPEVRPANYVPHCDRAGVVC